MENSNQKFTTDFFGSVYSTKSHTMNEFENILLALAELGMKAVKSSNPELEALGAAILSIPMAAADSEEDLNQLFVAMFRVSKERIQRNEEIEKLLTNED